MSKSEHQALFDQLNMRKLWTVSLKLTILFFMKIWDSKSILTLLILLLLSGCSRWGETRYVVKKRGVYYETYGTEPTTGLSFNVKRKLRRIDADPKTFEILDFDFWGKDKKQGYYKGQPVLGSNASSFRAIGKYFAADNRHVWQGSYSIKGPVKGADSATFQIIGKNYAVDKASAYYTKYPALRFIPCDLSTFKELESDFYLDAYAIDSECVYSDATMIDITDRRTFRLLGGGYATDGFGVYWGSSKLEEVDVESFYVPKGMRYGRDKTGCWTATWYKPCLEK